MIDNPADALITLGVFSGVDFNNSASVPCLSMSLFNGHVHFQTLWNAHSTVRPMWLFESRP